MFREVACVLLVGAMHAKLVCPVEGPVAGLRAATKGVLVVDGCLTAEDVGDEVLAIRGDGPRLQEWTCMFGSMSEVPGWECSSLLLD